MHDKNEKAAVSTVVYTVEQAGRMLGFSRKGSYDLAKRGDLPTIRLGRRIVVPREAFHLKFGK
jgi:excisionase family DNA binding protein